jgi:hypothetical protein
MKYSIFAEIQTRTSGWTGLFILNGMPQSFKTLFRFDSQGHWMQQASRCLLALFGPNTSNPPSIEGAAADAARNCSNLC